jgi:serine/threonine protein kinase
VADDTLVGTNLGQYEVLSLLGRGLFSAVYRAYEASVNRTIALKVLPADFLRDPQFMEGSAGARL